MASSLLLGRYDQQAFGKEMLVVRRYTLVQGSRLLLLVRKVGLQQRK